ncbi:hypothetical protein MRS44_015381 [Fusarium solani]|uniref:uncharacterized protein n=1 Tax=Fusarium solani TaxID=169388 RepID=UPI0032C48B33|nr:hypothetical protein MRS44_015381 [Fusarium solani]
MEVQGGSSQRHSNSDSSSRLFINRRDSSGDAEFLTKNAEHAIESWVLNAPDPPPCFQDIKENFKDIFNNHKNPDASPVKPFINFIINIRLQNGPVDPGSPFKLPGYGLPLTRHTSVFGPHAPYLHGVYGGWYAPTLTNREVCMLKFVEDITNEPEWWLKVREPETVLQWKRQVLELPWAEYRPHADFTETMADACLVELAKKAKLFEETERLAARYRWKGSQRGGFIDLVVGIWDVQNLAPANMYRLTAASTTVAWERPFLSRLNQCWPPYSDAAPVEDESFWDTFSVAFLQYRPDRREASHRQLHQQSASSWDIVFRSTDEAFEVSRFQRIKAIKYRCSVPEVCRYTCEPNNRPGGPQDDDSDYTEESQRLDQEWWEATHELLLPEPSLDEGYLAKLQASQVRDKGFFKRDVQTPSPRAMVGIEVSQIQVIVEMANIHLTPEKPTYEGSPWQIEGQAIERICATSLFCYDCDNIADTPISFRTQGDRENLGDKVHYIYGDWLRIERGQAIFYPNVYQNRLGPFELADKTRPGHCKMPALFLVDPMNPIISTANIPPQQRDWWSEKFADLPLVRNLPPEIWHQINENIDFPIDKETARKTREEMTSERLAINKEINEKWRTLDWDFPQH